MSDQEKSEEFLLTRHKNEKLRYQGAFFVLQNYNNVYFKEIYEECLVRLPLHPSKE
jgi:hypothetical protein